MTTSRFATIHGGLLARKGEAAPAIRHAQVQMSYSDRPVTAPAASTAPPVPGPPPAMPASPASRTEAVANAKPTLPTPPSCGMRPGVPAGTVAAGGREKPGGRASLRLTARQKRMVLIATAVLGRSQQRLLSDALDGYLNQLGASDLRSCACFNSHLRADTRSR